MTLLKRLRCLWGHTDIDRRVISYVREPFHGTETDIPAEVAYRCLDCGAAIVRNENRLTWFYEDQWDWGMKARDEREAKELRAKLLREVRW